MVRILILVNGVMRLVIFQAVSIEYQIFIVRNTWGKARKIFSFITIPALVSSCDTLI